MPPAISASKSERSIPLITFPPYPFGKGVEECCCHTSRISEGIVMTLAHDENFSPLQVPYSTETISCLFLLPSSSAYKLLRLSMLWINLRGKFPGQNVRRDLRCPWQWLHALPPRELRDSASPR